MSKTHIIKLTKGQDILPAIHEYLMDKKWNDSIIVSALGSINNVFLSNPGSLDMPPELIKKKIFDPCEVLSFVGEITPKEHAAPDLPPVILETPSPYIVHVHCSVSHAEGIVNGGGFRGGNVLRALTIYVVELDPDELKEE